MYPAANAALRLTQHGQPVERSDGGGDVLLGVVQFLDVAADLLHHDLTGLSFGADLPHLPRQLLPATGQGWGREEPREKASRTSRDEGMTHEGVKC